LDSSKRERLNAHIARKLERDEAEFKKKYEEAKLKFTTHYRKLFGVVRENEDFDILCTQLFNQQINHQLRGLWEGPTLGETRR